MQQLSLFETVEEKKEATEKKAWLFADGNNLMYRAYFATEKQNRKALDGTPISAMSKCLEMLLNMQEEYGCHVAVFFDHGESFRKALYSEYKEGRKPTPSDLVPQMTLIRKLLTSAGIPIFSDEKTKLEADDLISIACNNIEGQKYVLSNDKDLLQLVSEDVTVISRKGKFDVLITPEKFSEDWEGLSPLQIRDVKALAGDTSDNIPGITGIGDTGAMKLIQHFGQVENISLPMPKHLKRYEKYFTSENIEKMCFWKQFVTLKSIGIMSLNSYEIDRNSLSAACESFQMKSVVRLLNK